MSFNDNNGIASLLQTSKTTKSRLKTSVMNGFQFINDVDTCRSAPRSRAIVFSVTWAKHTTEACKRMKCANKTASANRARVYNRWKPKGLETLSAMAVLLTICGYAFIINNYV